MNFCFLPKRNNIISHQKFDPKIVLVSATDHQVQAACHFFAVGCSITVLILCAVCLGCSCEQTLCYLVALLVMAILQGYRF